MAKDKLKREDEPPGCTSPLPWIEESEIPARSIEVANFMGTLDNSNAAGADDLTMPHMTMPFSLYPFGDRVHGTTNPYAMAMPLTGIDSRTDLTPFRNSQDPIFDYSSVYGKGDIPAPPTPVSNFIGSQGNKTGFNQYPTPGYAVPPDNMVNARSDVNFLQGPYADRKIVTVKGNSAANLKSNQQNEVNSNTETAIKRNSMVIEAQEDSPEKFGSSFLTLGTGQKTEDLSTSNTSGVNLANNFERVFLPQSNTVHGQEEYSSSLNPSPNVAAGLSFLQNNANGMNVMTNSIPQDDKQHHYLMLRNRNISHGVEGNWGTGSAYIDPNNSFQAYPGISLIPVGSSLTGLPDSGRNRAYGLPLSSSSSKSTCLPVSETSRNLSSDSSMGFPPIGVTRSTSHDLFGKPFTANGGIAGQVSAGGDGRGELSFRQLPSNYYQRQVPSAVQSSTNLSGSVVTGEEIPITKLHKTAQGSSAFVQRILKRVAEESPPATYRAQSIARRAESSVGSSTRALSLNMTSLPNLSKASSVTGAPPSVPSLPHPAKTTTLHPLLSQHSRSLPPQAVGTASFPPLSQYAPSPPTQTNGTYSFTPPLQATLSFPTVGSHTTVHPPLSQIASFLPSQGITITSRPSLPQIAPYLRPKPKSNMLLPAISQNALSLLPQPQIPPPLLSQANTTTSHPSPPQRPNFKITAAHLSQNASSVSPLPQIARPLPSQPLTGPSFQPKPRTAPSVQLKAQTAPPLPLKPRAAPSLPVSPQIAPPFPQNASSVSPLPQIARPLPSQPLTGPSFQPKPRTAPSVQLKAQTAPHLPLKPRAAPSLPVSPQIAPPFPPQAPAASTSYIKWKGVGQTQPLGHKCLICKRDISFTPEGPVSMPTIQPVAAVLPCGHTFHDHCLQLITPQDQAKDPPCIPCAIGED